MAYSDYGGYAFRNGVRVEERSDAVLSPEGVQSTPGQWPGWTLEVGRSGRSFHALLGDGPVFVGLYKQSVVTLFRLSEELDLAAYGVDLPAEALVEWEGKTYIEVDPFRETETPAVFKVDGYTLTVYFLEFENFYCYAQFEQPDGTVWHGWSGYGVGAGLESGDHGFDTEKQTERCAELFNVVLS